MKRIDFLERILIVLVFSIIFIGKTGALDFEVYNSWDFESEDLGDYTDAEIREYFDVFHYYNHGYPIIAEDIINGEVTKVFKMTNLAGQLGGIDLQVGVGADYNELYLSYNFKFSEEFNSTSGGKLPGFCGYPSSFSADQCPPDDEGFVIKSMFKQAGRMITYHYDRTTGNCPWASEAYIYDTVFFNNGCWYNITRRLVMNTFTGGIANADGIHEVWVDGRMIFKETGLKIMLVESETMKIDGVHIAHWYGGSSDNYKPITTCYGYIDNIKVWTPVNDPTVGTNNTHDENYILPTPDVITDRRVYFDSLRTTPGALQNSDFGSTYSPCIDEAFLLDAGEGKKVIFTIETGTIGGGDYLFFYDGDQTDSELLDVVVGYDNSFTGTRTSSGRYMFVRFSSNQDVGSTGWRGTIQFSNVGSTINTNNPPIIIENQEFRVSEAVYNGNCIGNVLAVEDDPGQTVTYSIVAGNESGLFTIDADSGNLWITDEGIFDLEPKEYGLTVRVADNGEGNLSDEAVVSILLEKYTPVVYIDPENKNDALEDGSLQHPFDSWQDVVWMSDYSYLQKSGTIADESKILVLSDHVLIGSYGKGEQPVIRSTAEDYAISFFEKSNITIQNIQIVAENAISSLYFLGDISDYITIENSKFEGSIYGVRILGGKNFTIQYNSFRGNSEAVYSYALSTKVYYNIFQNNQDALHIDGNNSLAEIYNNVFYDNNTAVATEFSELTLYNNIFYLTKDFDKAISFNGTRLVSDHNIFYPSQDGFVSYNGQEFNDLSELQQVQGIDMNSFVSDPLFVDAFNHNFAVENESPAIDAGIYVGITADLLGEGVPYGNNPDIGVIEVPIAVNPISFISADEPNDLLQVFPNPSNGIFTICMDNPDQEQTIVHIRDINGHKMLEKQYSDKDKRFEQLLDISNFPAGMYILSMKIANSLYSRRIVKIL